MILKAALLAFIVGTPPPREIAVGTSVEWGVTTAGWIGTGTIVEVKSGETDGFYLWEEATLRVTETLKGDKKEFVSFGARFFSGGEKASAWKRDGCEILLFLTEGKQLLVEDPKYANHDWSFVRVEACAFRLDGAPKQPMFDTSFAVHRTKKDILAATRAAVQGMQKDKPESIRVEVPWDSPAFKALYGGSSVFLIVPLDKSMEARARIWLANGDAELATTAVGILGRLKSDENVAHLKTALSDTRSWIEQAGGNPRKNVYPVRREAARVLREWKIEFTEPVLEEPVRGR